MYIHTHIYLHTYAHSAGHNKKQQQTAMSKVGGWQGRASPSLSGARSFAVRCPSNQLPLQVPFSLYLCVSLCLSLSHWVCLSFSLYMYAHTHLTHTSHAL